jgi:hypothetical protein
MVGVGTVVLGTVTGEGAPAPGPLDPDPEPPDMAAFPIPRVRRSKTSGVPVSAVVTKPPMLGLEILHDENWIGISAGTSMPQMVRSVDTGKVTDLVNLTWRPLLDHVVGQLENV